MNRMKLPLGIILAVVLLITQVGGVFAAPISQETTPISGTVQRITLEADPTTGIFTVVLKVVDAEMAVQTIRVSQETAIELELVLLDGDGNPVINESAPGKTVEIEPTTVIPEQEESQHPVGSALATFFSDIEGMDYDTIMAAHEDGVGFGVIAQALWLTSELEGDSVLFQDLLYAKEHKDYSAFSDFTDDGTAPKSWGQLRKALLSKKSLGIVMSSHENNSTPANEIANNNKDKEKNKDKNKNGNGTGNNDKGNGNGHTK